METGELGGWTIDPTNVSEWITEAALKHSSAKLFPDGTILMAMYGDGQTIGNLGLVEAPVSSNQACCALIVDRKVCDPLFLFYVLMDRRTDLIRLAHGGAQRNLSCRIIGEYVVPVPSINRQRRTIGLLRNYDDLIENNTRRIAVLEEMARRIFEEWFVRFRAPGAKQTRGLPEGWVSGTVEQLATLDGVNINPAASPDTKFAHFSFPAFDEGKLPTIELGSKIQSNKIRFNAGVALLGKLNPRFQ